MGEHTLTYVQGLAALVALVSSVLTVYADRGEDHRLSAKGKVTLVSAMVAGAIAFWLLALQSSNDRAKAASDRQKALEQARTNEVLLRNVQRQLYPIMPQQAITISSEWEISLTEPEMKDYATRVYGLIEPVKTGRMTAREWCERNESRVEKKKVCQNSFLYTTGPGDYRGPLASIYFDKASKLYPTKQEADVLRVLENFGTRVCVSQKIRKSICNNADFEIDSTADKKTEFRLDLYLETPMLAISAGEMSIGGSVSSAGVITSVMDLSNAYMEIQYHDLGDANDTQVRLLNAMRPNHVRLAIQGRSYFIGYKPDFGPAPFSCKLQDGIENTFGNVTCSEF